MPLPGRPKTFAIEASRDMLLKLEREIERYKTAQVLDDVDELKDIAFNAAVTAWQMADWVFEDMTPAQRDDLRLGTLAELQAHARDCRAVHLCRQIATASKHYKVDRKPDPTADAIVMHNGSRWVLLFVDGDERIPAGDIFKMALAFWTSFIYGRGVGK